MIGTLWSRVRNRLYDKGVLNVVRPNEFVTSVGNITWGGTGKTALTEYLTKALIENGFRVAILSRGYGRQSGGVVVVSDGRKLLVTCSEAGDEPFLLATKIPQAPVVVAESRSDALEAISKFAAEVIVLDDAFQHRQIARDIDLVLVDASENIRNLHVIPFGKLREPIDSLHRASAIVLMHSNHSNKETLDAIQSLTIPVFHANYYPVQFQFSGKCVAAFCGIASPDHFRTLLEEHGAELVFFRKFPDHHIYSSSELNQLQDEAKRAGAEALITTAKDGVKLNAGDFHFPFAIINADLRVEEGEKFNTWIIERLKSSKSAAVMNHSL
jgi:tetraacyldisaccharide 4'-kinase